MWLRLVLTVSHPLRVHNDIPFHTNPLFSRSTLLYNMTDLSRPLIPIAPILFPSFPPKKTSYVDPHSLRFCVCTGVESYVMKNSFDLNYELSESGKKTTKKFQFS